MATWQQSIQSSRPPPPPHRRPLPPRPPPPPPKYTCCHHLSVARRHSLSQQMRGLSERAPQFLRDAGERGGSGTRRALVSSDCAAAAAAALQPTGVQSPEPSISSVTVGCWNSGRKREDNPESTGGCFPVVELNFLQLDFVFLEGLGVVVCCT